MYNKHLISLVFKQINATCGLLILCLTLALFSSTIVKGQRNLALYNLSSVPQSMSLNPGRVPLSNIYVGIPVIGSINASYSNNSRLRFGDLSLDNEEQDFYDNNFADILELVDRNNQLITDINATWLEFGFRVDKNFFSFLLRDYAQFQVDYPEDLFTLLNDVTQEGIDIEDGKMYLLNTLGANGMHFRAYGLGFTRILTPNLSAGIRLNFLSGIANATTFNRGLEVTHKSDNEYFNLMGRLDVFASGLQTLENDPDRYFRGRGNHGFSIDFGFNYSINEQIEIFASALNMGRINWKNDLTHASFVAEDIELSSENVDEFEAEIDDFINDIQMTSTEQIGSYHTKLPVMAYFGGNYYFGEDISAGLILNPRFFNGDVDWAYAVSLQKRFNKFLQASLMYVSHDQSSSGLGAGLAVNAGPLQVYFASDNVIPLFDLDNAKNIQFNAGLNLSFGRISRNEQHVSWRRLWNDITDVAESIPLPKLKSNESKDKSKDDDSPEVAEAEGVPGRNTTLAGSMDLLPRVTLMAKAYHPLTNETLTGIAIEVYRYKGVDQTLELFNSFLNGEIKVTLERDQSYRILVKKPGFEDADIQVTPIDMEDKNIIEKNITMSVMKMVSGTSETATPQKKEKPETPVATTTPKPESKPEPKAKQKEDKSKSNTYTLLDATSLRSGPSHTTSVLLRFSPGNQVKVLEQTNQYWWKVHHNGKEGYVKAALLEQMK